MRAPERVHARTSASQLVLARRGGRRVVLKRSAEIDREARMLVRARGDGVVGLIAQSERELTLEHLRGPTLAERPLDRRAVRALAKRLITVVERLHRLGIVHGDLKPENVILPDGDARRATLIDFETARLVGEQTSARVTVGFTAPELLSGPIAAAPAQDIFALGAVLWAAERGRSPFDAETRDAVVLRVLAVDPEPLERLGALGDVILAMLDKDPARRTVVAPPKHTVLRVDGGARGPFGPLAIALARAGSHELARVALHTGAVELASDPETVERRATLAFLRFMRRARCPIEIACALDPQSEHALAAWQAEDRRARVERVAPRLEGPGSAPSDPVARAHGAWRAAVRAIEGSSLDEAASLLDAAECEPTSSVARLQIGLNDALRAQLARWRGDHRAAQRHAREALARLPIGTRAWCEALGERATASGKVGDRADLSAVAAALRAEPSEDARAAWDRACSRTGVQLHYQGLGREARALERLFRARTDPPRRAASPGILIVGALFAGRLDEYLAILRAAVRSFLEQGDVKSACLYGASVGYAWAELGHFARAERDLRRMVALARRSGLPTLVTLARHNLGYVLTLRGDLDGAVREETLAIDALTGDPRLLAGSLAYRGRAHLAAGELERAEADARAACAVDRASSAGLLAEAALAEVLLARHRPAEALERALRACELADGAGPVEAGDALARLCRVRALAALGKDARPLARAAWRRIVARANKIADDSLRARFLTRIPEHRATRSFVT